MPPLKIRLEFRQQVFLGLTGALLVVILSLRFIYLPVLARINERRALLTDLRVKIADAQVLAGQLPGQEQALQLAREHYGDALESWIGKEQSVARILERLSAQAKDHRLELVAIQPRAEDHEPRVVILGPEVTLREVPLTLQLTGRYRQLGEFLGDLPTAPFLASIRELKMTKPQADRAELRTDLVLAVYLSEGATSR